MKLAYLKIACILLALNEIVREYGFTRTVFSHERNNVCDFAVPMPSAKADDDVMLITAVSSDLDHISVSPCPFGTIVVPI